ESCRSDRNPAVGILRRGFAVCGGGGPPPAGGAGGGEPDYPRPTDGKDPWGGPPAGASPVAESDEGGWAWGTAARAAGERGRARLEQMRDPEAGAEDLAVIERTLAQIGRQQATLAQAVALMGDNPDGVAPLLAHLDLLGKQRKATEADRAELLARQARA